MQKNYGLGWAMTSRITAISATHTPTNFQQGLNYLTLLRHRPRYNSLLDARPTLLRFDFALI